MEKQVIRIALDDFVIKSGEMSFFLDILKEKYQIIEVEEQPDIVFYSCFGLKHLKRKNCVKVLICQENVIPDFNECDYAISCAPISFGKRHFYLPPYLATHLSKTTVAPPAPATAAARRKFCSFIYSQDNSGAGSMLRKEFCEQLMKYKNVDCPGKILHNIDIPDLSARFSDNWNQSKIEFLSNYKFNIAFENSYSEGYVTEKLMDCFLAGTIPIYWGGYHDNLKVPKESMIFVNEYDDFDSVIAAIRELDENDELYLSKLRANPLLNGYDFAPVKDALRLFLHNIIEHRLTPYEKDERAFGNASILKILAHSGALLPAYLALGALQAFWRFINPVLPSFLQAAPKYTRQQDHWLLYKISSYFRK